MILYPTKPVRDILEEVIEKETEFEDKIL